MDEGGLARIRVGEGKEMKGIEGVSMGRTTGGDGRYTGGRC